MVASYVIWYIVVGHPAGVLVFLWVWMLMGFYALLKFPKFVVVGEYPTILFLRLWRLTN